MAKPLAFPLTTTEIGKFELDIAVPDVGPTDSQLLNELNPTLNGELPVSVVIEICCDAAEEPQNVSVLPGAPLTINVVAWARGVARLPSAIAATATKGIASLKVFIVLRMLELHAVGGFPFSAAHGAPHYAAIPIPETIVGCEQPSGMLTAPQNS